MTTPIVGLVPAAGRATRLGDIPCSKEVYPIGGARVGSTHPERPKVACEYLLEMMAAADIDTAYVILRPEKRDIPEHLDRLEGLALDISYLTIEGSRSVPETLDRAFPHLGDRRVALGYPDILIRPADAFRKVAALQEEHRSDIVLGLFPTDQDERSDMVEIDDRGRVRRIVIKQPPEGLLYTWMIAVWTPRFTRYLHRYLETPAYRSAQQEVYPGHIVQAALEDGFTIDSVVFTEGEAIDVGTPEGLRQGIERFGGPCRQSS